MFYRTELYCTYTGNAFLFYFRSQMTRVVKKLTSLEIIGLHSLVL